MGGVTLDTVTSLPAALQVILQTVATDGARARAETLTAILGDPVAFRSHVARLDAALGSASPGIHGLIELVDKAERAVSTSSGTVNDQHVLSQVVLRRFVENIPPRGRILARFNFAYSKQYLKGTAGVGVVENFVPVDSETTETLWQEVENDLSAAIDAALDGAATPIHAQTLRRAVALHFVRNPQIVTVHNRAFIEAADLQVENLWNTPFAARAFWEHHSGLYVAGPEGLRMGIEASQGRLRQMFDEGGLFRLSVQRLFEKVSDRFDLRGVEIRTPASPGKEFVLGDVPALTVNNATGAVGLTGGVAIDEADEIVMPLAPRLVVAVGPPDGIRRMSDDEVDALNKSEVRLADSYAVYRPGANLKAAVQAWRLESTEGETP